MKRVFVAMGMVLLLFAQGAWAGNDDIQALKDILEKELVTYPSIYAMVNALQAIKGYHYVINPPLTDPEEKRYVAVPGVVETMQGNMVICLAGEDMPWRKWAFRHRISSYVPRAGQIVVVIGKISGLLRGHTVSGAQITGIIVEPVGIETYPSRTFYQLGSPTPLPHKEE